MNRVHLIVSGDVQGVGFRAWVVDRAQDLRLVGWVKNREDGAVEVVAERERYKLEILMKECHDGPDVAMVESVNAAWEEGIDEFVGFEVVY